MSVGFGDIEFKFKCFFTIFLFESLRFDRVSRTGIFCDISFSVFSFDLFSVNSVLFFS